MWCTEKYIPHFMECMYSEHIKDVVRRDELIDMFGLNQMNSKYELLKAISKLPKDEVKDVVYLGSWFGYLTHILCKDFDYTVTEIDIDERCKAVSERVNKGLKHEHMTHDANKIGSGYFLQFDMVINTSTEHMSDDWFKELEMGTMVAVQCNNFDTWKEHDYCVHSIEELKERFPLDRIIYESTLPCTIYDRYTLMGII